MTLMTSHAALLDIPIKLMTSHTVLFDIPIEINEIVQVRCNPILLAFLPFPFLFLFPFPAKKVWTVDFVAFLYLSRQGWTICAHILACDKEKNIRSASF